GRIESQGAALRFEAETDVFAFESALNEHRIADALPLRRGELLTGFDDDQSEGWSSWLGFERDRVGLVLRRRAPQVYREFVRRLTDDLGLSPAADLQALHDSLGSTLWSPSPLKPSATAT